MSRIKGWKKVLETKKYIKFIHKNQRGWNWSRIDIVKYSPSVHLYTYPNKWKCTYYKNGEMKWVKEFKTKIQALKYAKAWMKKHPNG